MARIHNFSAGPAVLPEPVIREAQEALWDLNGSGIGICESSHRWPLFDEVICSARDRLRRLLKLSDDQEVLFLQGGAQSQFYQVPMNLLRGGRAVYLDTGTWAQGAAKEADRFGDVAVPFSSAETAYNRVPRQREWGAMPKDVVYLHYTSNNTVAGTQYSYRPDANGSWLVCDMSSDICSRPIDGSQFDLIYAGAQKNLGPSGVTLVILRRSLLERCDPAIPTMLRYGIQVEKQSMKNTPNTFGIYIVDRVCNWIEEQGGLKAIEARNEAQAGKLYDIIDGSDFWTGKAELDSRSRMNVTWSTGDADLDTKLWKGAEGHGIKGLKGHRIVGGLRATIYNAQTDAAVDALAEYMREFERTNG